MEAEDDVITMDGELPRPDADVDVVVGEVALRHSRVSVMLVFEGDEEVLRIVSHHLDVIFAHPEPRAESPSYRVSACCRSNAVVPGPCRVGAPARCSCPERTQQQRMSPAGAPWGCQASPC
jgi:hypothetical protein